MNIAKRFVLDTVSLISVFGHVFERPNILSKASYSIVYDAVFVDHSKSRISIPSAVFIEIYNKWCVSEEFVRKFRYEVFGPLTSSPNVEVKELDREVLATVMELGENLEHHEVNDKIIVASALVLECPIITTDSEIIEYSKLNPKRLVVLQ